LPELPHCAFFDAAASRRYHAREWFTRAIHGNSGDRARPTPMDIIPTERTNVVTYVICQPCIGVKDASCVDVCPVDCIHAGEEDEQYFIDPDECIDCGACEPACPVDAIFEEGAVPPEWREFIEINAANTARLLR
jgi:NAD-dependent dihydropyrimidine dehydrogenase PreA subunit